MKDKKLFKVAGRILIFILAFIIVTVVFFVGTNIYVKKTVADNIITVKEAKELEDVDCILVLGASVTNGDTPSPMLEDRLKRGVELYYEGCAPKLLMSGDHGGVYYDEVNVMKNYAKDQGVASSDIFMDHAGFSTYESLYRAADVFCAKKIIIVSQEYHLYRALYIAQKLGLDAYGVHADYRGYTNQLSRDIREVLARVKDFGTSILQPEPAYLGETIPVWGDGDLTNDDSSAFG